MIGEQVKNSSLGDWKSITVEVRPSNTKNADGKFETVLFDKGFYFIT